ncbi:MAG: DegV family protein, partial [Lachnospiraceae bacterium]|nr:DegV family protein [Lachnospiraceae bacterium]
TRQKAKKNLVKLIDKYFSENHLNYNDYNFLVGTGFELEEAENFENLLEESLPIKCTHNVESRIGTTIGCHTGPYPLGVAFIKKYDV